MKIISTPSFRNLSIAFIFCSVIMTSASCSKNDEPDLDDNSGSESTMPTINRLNINDFNGYFLTNIREDITREYTNSNGSTSTYHNSRYLGIRYNAFNNYNHNIYDINIDIDSGPQLFFSYPDIVSMYGTDGYFHTISDREVNFSPQGLFSQINYKDYYAYAGNVHQSFIDKDITYIFTYDKAGYLLECKAEIKSDEYSYDGYEDKRIKATATATTSYEWEEGNLMTVTYDYQTTDPSKSPYTKKYELSYSDVENTFRQYPYFLTQFLLDDEYMTPCFTVGLMGKGPAKTLQKITVTNRNGEKTTQDIKISYKYLNGRKVLDKENFERNTNTSDNKEYWEYTYTYEPVGSVSQGK